jgi:hypothetical protein
MKDTLIAGDTLDFTVTVADFPPAAGWTLKYRLVPRAAAGVAISFTAGTSGSDYRVQVAPATTVTWVAGEYSWFSWVEKTGARQTVDDGLVTIKPDPFSVAAGYDARTSARKVLEAIQAVLENRATMDQMEYAIGGRSLKRTPIADLLVLRDKYRTEVSNEDAAEKIAAGLGNPRNFGVRFNRV